MLLNKLAAVFAQRKSASSPIYESVKEIRADELDVVSLHSADGSVTDGCADTMPRVDSGHETLVDDDSPTPTFDGDGVDLNTTLSEQHIYEEVSGRRAPPRLPDISGVLHNKGPVIRPVACRPTPTHTPSATPSATPTLFGSMDRASVRRAPHYGSALELKCSGPAAGDRRSSSSMARSRYESLDSLRAAGAEPPASPGALLDEYRAYRAAVRPVEPRRESFSGRVDSRRQGLARHDSLRNLAPGGGGGGGGGGRIGGSVSNLAAAEPAFQLAAPARQRRSPASAQSTPSPADSGVVELEAALRERDSEVHHLRQTMQQNEQVYDEKEKTWEKELRKIQAIYDNRLKASQQRALKMEQMLTMQTYQLQQEKRKLRQELDETRREKDQAARQNEELRQELAALRTQLEDTEWGLCQKTGEISLLKSQLKDSQGDQTTRGHQMLHIRSQVREYVTQLEAKEVENKRLQLELSSLRNQTLERRADETGAVISQLQREMDRLRTELNLSRAQAQAQKESFEEERLHWLDEKQKVVNYQKQLQLNYMEMYKRNKSLEAGLTSRENKLNSSGESQC